MLLARILGKRGSPILYVRQAVPAGRHRLPSPPRRQPGRVVTGVAVLSLAMAVVVVSARPINIGTPPAAAGFRTPAVAAMPADTGKEPGFLPPGPSPSGESSQAGTGEAPPVLPTNGTTTGGTIIVLPTPNPPRPSVTPGPTSNPAPSSSPSESASPSASQSLGPPSPSGGLPSGSPSGSIPSASAEPSSSSHLPQG